MANRSIQYSIAVSLAICLLIVSAGLAGQAATHSFHHAHHDAKTHSSILCAWLCATGQGIHVLSLNLDLTFQVLVNPILPAPYTFPFVVVSSPGSRSPPLPTLS